MLVGIPSIIPTRPLLHSCMQRVIKEWFQLVDDDGSGTLEHHELLAALQVSPATCTHQADQHSRHMLYTVTEQACHAAAAVDRHMQAYHKPSQLIVLGARHKACTAVDM
jgi:hypothetical protein